MSSPQIETAIGTGGGTLGTVAWAMFHELPLDNIISSAIIGTIVSFFIMEGLKWAKSKIIKKKNGKIE